MKISVIVPYTTGAAMLEDCLESLKQQTVQDFEVIIVQDGIPDEVNENGNITVVEDITEILEQYKQVLSISYIPMVQNTGVGSSRNRGIKKVQGEYVYFLDMDDYLLEDCFEKMLQAQENCEYDILFGKQITTWYKRKVFLGLRAEKQQKEELEQQNSSDECTTKENEASQDADELNVDENKNPVTTSQNSDAVEEDDAQNMIEASELEKELSEFVRLKLMRRKGIRNISALHMLIRRSILIENDIFFDEGLPIYSDVVFVSKLIPHIKRVTYISDAYYVKRKRNNPVQYPSITQIKYEDRFKFLIDAYQKSKANLNSYPSMQKILDQKMINYYCNYFATKMRRSDMPYWRNERFVTMTEISKQWGQELIVRQNKYKRRLIKCLQAGNLKLSMLWINLHLGKKKAKKLFKNPKVLSTYLYFHYFSKMSIKENYVMCESFLGRNYADSPKNIFEYISKNYPNQYKFIWSVTKKTDFPYPCKVVKRFGIRYAYYLARSKYFVFNMRQPVWMRKKEGTVFVQTWHGTPLKRLVFDQEEVMSATPLYKQQVYRQSRQWDYLLSDNSFSTNAFRSCFLYDKEILEEGYPRNDLLHHPNREELAAQIKQKLKLPMDKKIILYAPTWRDNEYYDKGQYKFSLHMDLAQYKEALGDEYIMLLRTHYFIADQLDLSEYSGFAYNVSKYDDITELYLISDICITDYSSVFFDFANLKRPILFYTYDLEKYRDMLRGFYLNIETEVPGPLLFTDDEVIHAIRNINEVQQQYAEVYEQFWNRFCSLDDGNASKRIVEKIFDINQNVN